MIIAETVENWPEAAVAIVALISGTIVVVVWLMLYLKK